MAGWPARVKIRGRKFHGRSDRGAGGEPGNAGRSVRDPGRRRMQNIDAGALVGIVRRKGWVEQKRRRRPKPLQK